MDSPQAFLPLLDRHALRLRIELLSRHVGHKLVQPRLQPGALLFELNLLRRKLLEPHHVALLLQIERGDLIAHPGQVLRSGECGGLCLAQRLLLLAQFQFHRPQRFLAGRERLAVLFQGGLARAQTVADRNQLLLGCPAPLLSLRQVREGLGILRGKFPEPLFVEVDAALVPVNLALQLQPALLLHADLMFQLRYSRAQLRDLILAAQHARRAGLNFAPQIVHRRLPIGNLRL